jgi:hypothetical protein
VEDQSAPIPGERTSKLGETILFQCALLETKEATIPEEVPASLEEGKAVV